MCAADSKANNMPIMPMLGEYKVGATIGAGASSKVKAAVHGKDGRQAAIKIQRKNANGEHDAHHELEVLSHIARHVKARENIVDIYEVMESSRFLYIVLERVEGGDLFNTIVEEPLDEETARWVFRDVLAAMLSLQSIGVAHRDIKPENILVDFEQQVAKLSDFGLSKIHSGWEEGRTGLSQARVGTEAYAAPEVMSGRPYNAYTSDCYSFGVSLYCALTGRFPPSGGVDFTRGAASLLSAEAKDLLGRLMQPGADARPSMKAVAAHAWFTGDYGVSDEADSSDSA